MVRRLIPALILLGLAAFAVTSPASTGRRVYKETLVFDSFERGSFVDKPPAGPSVGDIERGAAKLHDARGHVVGTASDTCVFTRRVRGDMLERCTGTATTKEGTVSVSGVGHLNSMNPPWTVVGRSGAYRGARGKQVFATDIPLDPNVPLAAGRAFSVTVTEATVSRPLAVGVVPRPVANASFIRRALRLCRATVAKVRRLPGFPFDNFDPFNPDPQQLPQVGRFFNQPERRAIPADLLRRLRRLGEPPANRGAWRRVLAAREALIANERRQIAAALAGSAPKFVKTVYQQSRDFNAMVFASAVFGDEDCVFG